MVESVVEAVARYKSEADIRRYHQRYVDEYGYRAASDDIGYMTEDIQKMWYGALPEVSHPIFGPGFGRGKFDKTPEEIIEMGKKFARGELELPPRPPEKRPTKLSRALEEIE